MRPLFEHLSLVIVGAGCKNRCKHCSVDAKISTDALLSLEQVEVVISLLQAEGKKAPHLYGRVFPCLMYEPMDHPEIVTIQKLFHQLNPDAGLVRTMATNGQRIANDDSYIHLIQSLWKNGVEQFQLTLHGLADTHDNFVSRQGAHRDIMEAARRIASLKVNIQWIYFLTKANMAEFVEMIGQARDVGGGNTGTESISIWGPVGRAANHSRMLVTAEDVERLPIFIKTMEFLPQHFPESHWIELATSGEMQCQLNNFLREAKMKGGVPDCTLRVTGYNVGNFNEVLAQTRTNGTSQRTATNKPMSTVPELRWLADRYGETISSVLYRVSTMRQEWLRRWRQDEARTNSRTKEQ